MAKHNIAFFECSERESAEIKSLLATKPELADSKIAFHTSKPVGDSLIQAKEADVISVFVNSTVDRAVIDALPNLKVIVTRSTGFDHIDVGYARERGIKVANVPAYGSRTVAEYAFSLILGLSRKTFAATNQVKSGGGFDINDMMGFDLQGKTIGIVGTGRIGLNVAMIARGFGMNVIAYDAYPNKDQTAKIGFTYMSLEDLLAKSDVVSLHVPANKSTHHLINTENIRLFKKGAILVNTARGEVCDNEALAIGVKEKILAGVALDVIEGEKTLSKGDPLINMKEVFYTPHMAFFSREAEREIVETTIEDIAAFARGEDLNLVKVG